MTSLSAQLDDIHLVSFHMKYDAYISSLPIYTILTDSFIYFTYKQNLVLYLFFYKYLNKVYKKWITDNNNSTFNKIVIKICLRGPHQQATTLKHWKHFHFCLSMLDF